MRPLLDTINADRRQDHAETMNDETQTHMADGLQNCICFTGFKKFFLWKLHGNHAHGHVWPLKNPMDATTDELGDAMSALAAGESIANARTDSIGCSVKWKQ